MTGPLDDRAARSESASAAPLVLLPLLVLPPFIGRDTQPQRIEFNNSLGVLLVIRAIIRLEGGDRLIKQRILRPTPRYRHVALVKRNANVAIYH